MERKFESRESYQSPSRQREEVDYRRPDCRYVWLCRSRFGGYTPMVKMSLKEV